MIKGIPKLVKIVTVYNIVQIITMLYILSQYFDQTWLVILSLIEILFVIVTNYFLIKGKKWAWATILVWLLLITFTIEIPFFAWDLSFGLHLRTSWTLTLGSITIAIGLDFVSLILLFVHYESKRYFTPSIN